MISGQSDCPEKEERKDSGGRDVAAVLCPMTSGGMDDA